MRSRRLDFHVPCRTVFFVALWLVTASTAQRVPAADAGPPEEITVAETFDGQPFSYRVNSVEAMSGFSVHYLTYPSPITSELPQNNTIHHQLLRMFDQYKNHKD